MEGFRPSLLSCLGRWCDHVAEAAAQRELTATSGGKPPARPTAASKPADGGGEKPAGEAAAAGEAGGKAGEEMSGLKAHTWWRHSLRLLKKQQDAEPDSHRLMQLVEDKS